jgi:PAS domain S-box-containing protein/diguanylate cyclase (GGDEF)-like protein
MQQLAGTVLGLVVNSAPEGVIVCDARGNDRPIVYVNPAFERLSGYSAADLLGRNPRLLRGDDQDQDGCRRMREALARGEGAHVTLRNYRKDGSMFWNEIQIQPLHDEAGELTHFAAYYRDVAERIKLPEKVLDGVPTWLREDRVSGLSSRAWFEELMRRDWDVARRDERPLTLLLFDIDDLERYCETFGKSAGDAVIRRVARLISTCFRRGADVIGRWDNGCAAVLAGPVIPEGVNAYAQIVSQRVADMRLHHPRGVNQKIITVSSGVATAVPVRDDGGCARLVRAAESALRRAQSGGGGVVVVASEADFAAPEQPQT